MKSKLFINLTRNNQILFFPLSFLIGWGIHNLNLVSIMKLLGELSFEVYPILMLIQGALLFVCTSLFQRLASKSEKSFFLLTIATALSVIILGNLSNPEDTFGVSRVYFSSVIFLLSTVSIFSVDLALKLFTSHHVSILKNPNISGQLSFSLECGVIVGATLAIFSKDITSIHDSLLFGAPFIGTLFLLQLIFFTQKFSHSNSKKVIQVEKAREKVDLKSFPFIKSFLILSTAILLIRNMQGFAVLLGVKDLNQMYAESGGLVGIFSRISFVQTLGILFVLIPSVFGLKKAGGWSKGFRLFFGIQACSMFFISFFIHPLALVGTGALRKIIYRGFFNQANTVLISCIPHFARFEIKNYTYRYSSTLSFIGLAVFSALPIYGIIPFQAIWFLIGLGAVFAFKEVKTLISSLNEFHAKNIELFKTKEVSLNEAISSCYALANIDASKYDRLLQKAYSKNSRPIFLKSAIYALGKMESQRNVSFLKNAFFEAKREDVQLAIIESLEHYRSPYIELFYKKALGQVMEEDTVKGDLRLFVCEELSSQVREVALLTCLEVIEKYQDNDGVVANCVEVIGNMAMDSKNRSKNISIILLKYLRPEFGLRTRVNAARNLYFYPAHRELVNKYMQELKETDERNAQSAIAYLAGCLKLKQWLPYIIEMNEKREAKNSTVLLGLMKLGHKPAFRQFLELIFTCESYQKTVRHMSQLYWLKETQRYPVYFELLLEFPERIEHFLNLLADTQRNFDHDREVILSEARRMEIDFSTDGKNDLKIAS